MDLYTFCLKGLISHFCDLDTYTFRQQFEHSKFESLGVSEIHWRSVIKTPLESSVELQCLKFSEFSLNLRDITNSNLECTERGVQ